MGRENGPGVEMGMKDFSDVTSHPEAAAINDRISDSAESLLKTYESVRDPKDRLGEYTKYILEKVLEKKGVKIPE